MGLLDFFSAQGEEKRAQERAVERYNELKAAIERSDLSEAQRQLQWVDEKTKERWKSLRHPELLALEKGNKDVYEAVLAVYPGIQNQTFSDDGYKKSSLYYAIEKGKTDIALFMIGHPDTKANYSGEIKKSPIELAREKGLIGVTAALAERIAADKRKRAEELATEAAELSKLSLRADFEDVAAPDLSEIPEEQRIAVTVDEVAAAIGKSDAEEVVRLMRYANKDSIAGMSFKGLVTKSLESGNITILRTVSRKIHPETDGFLINGDSNNRVKVRSYLHAAMEKGLAGMAFSLARDPVVDVEARGVEDKTSSLDLARQTKGMTQVAIVIAQRMAQTRQAEAELLSFEAAQLKNLKLKDGTVRLPDPSQYQQAGSPPKVLHMEEPVRDTTGKHVISMNTPVP